MLFFQPGRGAANCPQVIHSFTTYCSVHIIVNGCYVRLGYKRIFTNYLRYWCPVQFLWWACQCFCLYVCLSVRKHIFGTVHPVRPVFPKFLCMLPMAVAWTSSGGAVIHCVLPVFWMTSYLRIGHMQACQYGCSEWRHCVVVCRLTPSLRRNSCVVS